MSKKQINWRFILVGYFALSVLALFDNVRGPLFPRLLEEFSLSNTSGSLFFSLASASAIFGSFLAGLMMIRFNLKPTTLFGFVLMVMGPLLIGLAPSYPVILIGAALWGVAFGAVSVVQNLWVQEGAPIALRRRLLTGLHSMYGATSVFAPAAASLTYAFDLSWRILFIIIGSLPVLVVLFFPWKAEIKSSPPVQSTSGGKGSWQQTAFAIFVGFYVAGELLLTTRLTLYLVRVESLSESLASLYLSYFFASLFLGRFLFSLIPMAVSSYAVLLISLALAFVCILFGLSGIEQFFFIAAFFMSPFFPVALDYIVSLFPNEPSKVLSYTIGVSSMIVVLMHILIGAITDWYGIKTAFMFDALLFLLAIIGIFVFHNFIARPKKQVVVQSHV